MELLEITPEEQRNEEIYETDGEIADINTDGIINQERYTQTASEISSNVNVDNQLITADREDQILGNGESQLDQNNLNRETMTFK